MTHEDPHSRSADPVHEGRPVEAQYVRQGRPGARILLLLLASGALAALLLFLIWVASQRPLESTGANADQAVGAQAFEQPTAPGETPAAPPAGN